MLWSEKKQRRVGDRYGREREENNIQGEGDGRDWGRYDYKRYKRFPLK